MKKNHTKAGVVILVILTLLFAAIGLDVKYSRKNVLTVGVFSGSEWDVPGTAYDKIFNLAIEKIKKEHPNLTVKYEEGIPVDSYSDWLAQKILKGQEPDVYLVLPEDFYTFVKTGALESLNGRIIVDGKFDKDVFYETAYNAGNYNNIQYALPFECNPRLMFVNKTLLKNEGIQIPDNNWTWENFSDICKKITKEKPEDGNSGQYGFCDYTWLDAVYSNGAIPFKDDGSDSYFTEDKVIDGVLFTKEMTDIQRNYNSNAIDFDLGRVAFRPLYFSHYRTYMPYPWRIKKYSQFEWNCLPMPAGERGENISYMETLMLGMSKRSVNKEIAWEFMKLLTTDEEIQTQLYVDSAGASPVKEVTRSSKVMEILNHDTPGDSQIDLSLLDDIISNAVVPKYFMNYNLIMEYADSHIRDFIDSGEEINLAMFQLKREIKQILK